MDLIVAGAPGTLKNRLRCSEFLYIMKLTTVILLFCCLSFSAHAFSQQVSLEATKAPIEQVFQKIEKQTGYYFFYEKGLLKDARPVTVRIKNASVDDALKRCFQDQPLTYTIVNGVIIVKEKKGPAQQPGEAKQVRAPAAPLFVKITGRVTDEAGTPLAGATVAVKGTALVTMTDKNGDFSLEVSNKQAVLAISFIGYQSTDITLSGETTVTIKLKLQDTAMDDLVVIGYGTVNKKDLTGSVGQVSMSDLQKAPVATFDQALAGRIAGVQVSSNDGQPGSSMNIVIRGGNSLTQSNAPLYVIDGFPVEENLNGILNPKDIESVTVLKDASATAIYGSRGANGVIVIETKKGKQGIPTLTYDGSLGYQMVTKKMELMSAYEFVKYQLEINPELATGSYLTVPGRTLEDYRTISPIDWQEKMFSAAPLQIHNLSLNGGTAQTKYAVSGSLFDQQGVIVNSGYQRYQGKVLLDQKINNKLALFANVNTSKEVTYGQPVSSSRSNSGQAYSTYLMYQIWGYSPIERGGVNLEEDPIDDMATDSRFNPYLSAKNELNRRTTTTLFGNARLTYNISKYLELVIRGGVNNRTLLHESFYNEQTSRGYPFPDNPKGVNGSVGNTYYNTWVNENLLTYKKRFNKVHNLDVIAGATFQSNKVRGNGYASQRLPNPELGIGGLAQGELSSLTSTISSNTLASFLSRVNYGYRSKYLLTASFRADGSSKFSDANKWGYFPSAALAWNMEKENFMKQLEFVSSSRLRVSYGITGNNRVGDFSYLSSLTMPFAQYYSYNNQTPQQGVLPATFGNSDLKWESTEQIDLGYELSLFQQRITLVVDLYRKNTSNLLMNAIVPYSTGFSTIYKNIGKVRNEGLELTLSTINYKTRDFEWSSNFNIAFNRNKVLNLSEGQEVFISSVGFPASYTAAQLYMAKVGGPAAAFFGYQWMGNYQVEDFDQQPNGTYLLKSSVPTNGNARQNIKPGDIRYKDFNGDGIVNDKDRVVIGRAIPIHIGGFNNNFVYRNLSLNVFFQWSYGNDIFNANRDMFEGNLYSRNNLNQYATYANRWTPENPNNTYFRSGGQGPTGMFSSRVIEDGSYLRLKTVSLNYRLPDAWVKRLRLKLIETYVAAQNLVTWTNYSGMDPEVSVQQTVLTPGFDYSAYPREKAVTFGLKVSL